MSIWGQLVDPILNSLNYQYKNYMVDSKKNYKHDLGVKGLSKDMDLKDQINHETD